MNSLNLKASWQSPKSCNTQPRIFPRFLGEMFSVLEDWMEENRVQSFRGLLNKDMGGRQGGFHSGEVVVVCEGSDEVRGSLRVVRNVYTLRSVRYVCAWVDFFHDSCGVEQYILSP